jgi:hypothetical protein
MEFTDVQRAELAALVKDRYAYPEVARRAQMILWESEGLAVGEIAALARVSLWGSRSRPEPLNCVIGMLRRHGMIVGRVLASAVSDLLSAGEPAVVARPLPGI